MINPGLKESEGSFAREEGLEEVLLLLAITLSSCLSFFYAYDAAWLIFMGELGSLACF